MSNCLNCGAPLAEGARFCENCGAKVDVSFHYFAPAADISSGGFATNVDSPEVVAALKKQKRATRIFGVIICILPLVGFAAYGYFSDSVDFPNALFYGAVVSIIFVLVMLLSALGNKLKKPFEGTVTDKKIKNDFTANDNKKTNTKYIIRFECEDGKRRKKNVSWADYSYLNLGDKVRYLPQFPRPFEKYNKAAEGKVMCMFCGREIPISEEKCTHCHNPLIK